ncbi:MAG: thioester reductase domain-containing protein [Cyanobacteria bacterium J06639_18]
MKPIEEFLSHLETLDIKIWVYKDRLRCNAPKGILTPDLRTQLSQRKAEIIKFLNHKTHSLKNNTLKTEVVLDPTISPKNLPTKFPTEPKNIFLTGATGFLGGFLLYELLQQTQANIYCLVRAENPEIAKKKIQNQLESYLLWNRDLSARIIPIIGDLSQAFLGLSKEKFQMMADKIEIIYHNGASVHLFYPYHKLKAINVLGTEEILRLASLEQVKPVHFISTLSVVQSFTYCTNQPVPEENLLDKWEDLYNGYAQSKWVAEKIVAIAQSRGIPISIYRPGMITGNSQTGVHKTQDLLSTLLKTFIQLKSAPKFDVVWDITPVDYVSQAIIHLSRQQQTSGKIFHVLNPQPIEMSVMIDFVRSFGYPIEDMSYDLWRTKLVKFIENSQENVLNSLLVIFPEKFSEEQLQVLQLKYGCQNTLNGLVGSSISCPQPNAELINTYLSYFIERGFVEAPKNLIKEVI